MATLESKAGAAQKWLAEQGEAAEEAAEIFSTVGAAYIRFTKEHKRPPTEEEAADIIAGCIDENIVATVEAAANPENDPFKEYRRSRQADDDDTL